MGTYRLSGDTLIGMDPQIIANIKSELALNQTKEKIISILKVQGYTEEAIQEAFAQVEKEVSSPEEVPVITSSVPPSTAPPVPEVVTQAAPTQTEAAIPQTSSSSVVKVVAIGLAVIAIVGAGTGFAYYQNIGPFAVKQYTEETLLSGMLEKAKGIRQASYASKAAFTVVPRDKNAVPFAVKGADPELDEKYESDYKNFSEISSLISTVNYNYGPRQTYDYATRSYKNIPGKHFPDKLASTDTKYFKMDATKYAYAKTEGGTNFAITLTFETDQAIDGIRKSSGYSATNTPINGRTVTFTKDSRRVYIPYRLPKPLLLELSDYLKYVSPDMSAAVELGAASDMSKGTTSNWMVNVSAVGNMGDLTYAVDVEGRKKDSGYYVRINKMPSLLSFVNVYKGQWIVFDTANVATSSARSAKSFSRAESSYKENRARFAESLRSLAQQADRDKLVRFRNAPSKEKVGDRTLYRYDLAINKSAIVPFFEHVMAEAEKYKDLDIVLSDSTLLYLKSEEFNQIFDYIDKNTWLTLWTDQAGYPAMLEYKLRIVPQDSAVKLADKQVDVVFTLSLDDINESVKVEVPDGAKTWEQVEEEAKKAYDRY